jgi:hypothetical protein
MTDTNVKPMTDTNGVNRCLTPTLERCLPLCWRGVFHYAGEMPSTMLERRVPLRWRDAFHYAGEM